MMNNLETSLGYFIRDKKGKMSTRCISNVLTMDYSLSIINRFDPKLGHVSLHTRIQITRRTDTKILTKKFNCMSFNIKK